MARLRSGGGVAVGKAGVMVGGGGLATGDGVDVAIGVGMAAVAEGVGVGIGAKGAAVGDGSAGRSASSGVGKAVGDNWASISFEGVAITLTVSSTQSGAWGVAVATVAAPIAAVASQPSASLALLAVPNNGRRARSPQEFLASRATLRP